MLVKSLDGGVWRCVGSTSDDQVMGHVVDADLGRFYIAVTGQTVSGFTFVNRYDANTRLSWQAALSSREFQAPRPDNYAEPPYSDEITISDDGQSITEQIAFNMGDGPIRVTRTYTRER